MAGRSEQYLEIKSYELETGRNIAYSDIVSRQKVCVIGAYVANELYGSSQNAIGDVLLKAGYQEEDYILVIGGSFGYVRVQKICGHRLWICRKKSGKNDCNFIRILRNNRSHTVDFMIYFNIEN